MKTKDLKRVVDNEIIMKKEMYNRNKLEKILGKLNPKDRKFLQSTIRKLDERDPLLTTIYNRRKFEQDLESKVSKADKNKENVSLIMIDIDGFKEYNDTYGHREGDRLLKSLVKPLRKTERNIYRYGGEEFAILLSNTDLTLGTKIALRLRKGVEEYFQESAGTTISLGVANYEAQKGNLKDKADALVKKADQALYHAKGAGKNRVKTYTPRLGPFQSTNS